MCWKSKYKPMLEIAEEDIPVKKVLNVKGDENGLEDALLAVKQARTIAKDENDMGTLWYAEKWLNTIKEKVVG